MLIQTNRPGVGQLTICLMNAEECTVYSGSSSMEKVPVHHGPGLLKVY